MPIRPTPPQNSHSGCREDSFSPRNWTCPPCARMISSPQSTAATPTPSVIRRSIASGPALVDHLAADHGRQHANVLDARGGNRQDVVGEDDEIGELAACDRALVSLLKLRE